MDDSRLKAFARPSASTKAAELEAKNAVLLLMRLSKDQQMLIYQEYKRNPNHTLVWAMRSGLLTSPQHLYWVLPANSTSGATLRHLRHWNDLLPSPGLRKQTAKMLADQQAHIKELHDAGRYNAAKWHVACTYGLWLWYVVMRPLSSLAKNLRGKVGGA